MLHPIGIVSHHLDLVKAIWPKLYELDLLLSVFAMPIFEAVSCGSAAIRVKVEFWRSFGGVEWSPHRVNTAPAAAPVRLTHLHRLFPDRSQSRVSKGELELQLKLESSQFFEKDNTPSLAVLKRNSQLRNACCRCCSAYATYGRTYP